MLQTASLWKTEYIASYQGRDSTDVMHTTQKHIIKLYTKTRILLLSIAVDVANAAVEELKSERESDYVNQDKNPGITNCSFPCSPFD